MSYWFHSWATFRRTTTVSHFKSNRNESNKIINEAKQNHRQQSSPKRLSGNVKKIKKQKKEKKKIILPDDNTKLYNIKGIEIKSKSPIRIHCWLVAKYMLTKIFPVFARIFACLAYFILVENFIFNERKQIANLINVKYSKKSINIDVLFYYYLLII